MQWGPSALARWTGLRTLSIVALAGLLASGLAMGARPSAAEPEAIGVPLPATYFTGSGAPDAPPPPCPPDGRTPLGEFCVWGGGGMSVTVSDDHIFAGENITATASGGPGGQITWTTSSFTVSGCQPGDTTCTFRPPTDGNHWRIVGAHVPGAPGQPVLAYGEAAYHVDGHLVEGTALIENLLPPELANEPFLHKTVALRLIRTDAAGNPTPYLYNGLHNITGEVVNAPASLATQGFCYFCGGGIDNNGLAGIDHLDGHFRFFVPEGHYKLIAIRNPIFHGEAPTLVPLPGWGTPITFLVDKDTEIHIRRDLKSIQGRVTSPNGQPLSGVTITARRTGTFTGASATTGSDGRYSMLVERGTYDILMPLERGRFNPTTRAVDVSQDNATGVDFVQETSRINGWLFSDEGAVRNWPVEAIGPSTQQARTDDSGFYEFELEPAFWTVRPVGGVWDPANDQIQLGSTSHTASFTCLDAEICGNPTLTLSYESGPSQLDIDESGTFVLTLANQGDQTVTNIVLTGPEPVSGTGAIDLVSGPTPPAPSELAPGASLPIEYEVVGDAEGRGRYRWSVTGEHDGETVGRSVFRDLQVGEDALEVVVEPLKPEVLMDVPDGNDVVVLTDELGGKHTIFKVRVRVTNTGTEPIINARVEGDLVIGTVEEITPDEAPYRNSQLAVDNPEIGLDVPDQPDPVLGTLQPGDPRELVYYLEALRPGTSALDAMVVGGDSAGTVSKTGSGKVKVIRDILVELRMKVDPNQVLPRLAGQGVRLVGELENLTSDKVIGVVPLVYYSSSDVAVGQSNATNGYLYNWAENQGGATPTSPVGFVLGPNQKIDVGAIIGTLPTSVASDAVVTYRLRAYEQGVDDQGGEKWTEISTRTRVLDDPDAGWNHPVRHRLLPNPPETFNPATSCGEVWGAEYVDWTWCGLVKGLENFATGLAQLPGLIVTLGDYAPWGRKTMQYQARILGLGLSALFQDEAAQQALADEARQNLETMKFAYGATWNAVSDQIPSALFGYLAQMDQMYRTGDENFVFQVGQLTGENIDFFVEAPLKAGLKVVTTITAAALARPSAQNRVVRAVNNFIDASHTEARSKIAAGVPIEQAAPSGMSAEPYLKGLGYKDVTIGKIKTVSKDTNTIIVYKTRDEVADAKIAGGSAWGKSEQFKQKTAKQIDIDEFGVPAEWKAEVVIVEPPFSNRLNGLPNPDLISAGERKALIEQLEQIVIETTPAAVGNSEDAVRLRKHLTTRAYEYVHFQHNMLPHLDDMKKHGIGELFQPNTQVGQEHVESTLTIVKFDYDVVTLPNGKKAWRPRTGSGSGLNGENANELRPLASDPDMVFILDADTGQIASADKRLQVMQAHYGDPTLGTTHGETGSIIDASGALRDKWMPSPTDAVLMVAPSEPVRFARVLKVEGTWMLIDGVKGVHWMGALGWSIPQVLVDGFAQYADALFKGLNIEGWRQRLGRLLNAGYDEQQAPNGAPAPVERFNRQGALINLTPAGALAQFGPVAGGGDAWSPLSYSDALASGTPGVMDPVPMTLLAQAAPAGATRLDVVERSELGVAGNSDWFQAGDRVVLDPGGPNQEFATVTGLGSLLLQAPLQRSHETGVLVALMPVPSAPNTTITAAAPVGLSRSASAEFSFVSNIASAVFECRLDTPVWAPCTSPRTFANVADGPHEFAVRAVANGLTDATPDTRTWTVDRMLPTIIVSSPGSGASYQKGQAVTATYACADPGGAIAPTNGCVGTVPTGATVDTSTVGSRTFTVTATDLAGNVATTTVTYQVTAAPSPTLALRVEAGAITPAAVRKDSSVALAGRWTVPAPSPMTCGENVTITIGSFTETLPGSRFKSVLGICTYVRPKATASYAALVALDLRRGLFTIVASGPTPTFSSFVNPMVIGLRIGDDAGTTSATFKRRGAAWLYPN